jgi:hypothetical protein
MAEHMQAVKTIWIIEYQRNTFPYRIRVDDGPDVPKTLDSLRKTGVAAVKVTEIRTCDAMPGMRYTFSNEVTL